MYWKKKPTTSGTLYNRLKFKYTCIVTNKRYEDTIIPFLQAICTVNTKNSEQSYMLHCLETHLGIQVLVECRGRRTDPQSRIVVMFTSTHIVAIDNFLIKKIKGDKTEGVIRHVLNYLHKKETIGITHYIVDDVTLGVCSENTALRTFVPTCDPDTFEKYYLDQELYRFGKLVKNINNKE